MCNACGFLCCALDSFDRCGCDHCPCPDCWDDDDDFDHDDAAVGDIIEAKAGVRPTWNDPKPAPFWERRS